jgi:hypothetical protein
VALVDLDLNEIGRTSLAFDFTIYRQADNVRCFEATITTVFLDLETHTPPHPRIPAPTSARHRLPGVLPDLFGHATIALGSQTDGRAAQRPAREERAMGSEASTFTLHRGFCIALLAAATLLAACGGGGTPRVI